MAETIHLFGLLSLSPRDLKAPSAAREPCGEGNPGGGEMKFGRTSKGGIMTALGARFGDWKQDRREQRKNTKKHSINLLQGEQSCGTPSDPLVKWGRIKGNVSSSAITSL